jgi:REP-associated tyrosine transposase
MPTDILPLTHGNFYHIYNRGNNRENIFPQERNYAYFMELWWKHINLVAETWAYCLLKNHFHAAVYIKDNLDLTASKDPSRYFSNFFNAYARGVNIATQRTGALFERPFRRIPVGRTNYLMQLIVYIHQNPQKHKFVDDFREWNYSSYHLLVSELPSRLQKEKVIELFGSIEDFVRIHQEIRPLSGLEDEE